MQSKQYFTKIKNYPHEKSTEPLSGVDDNSQVVIAGQTRLADGVEVEVSK